MSFFRRLLKPKEAPPAQAAAAEPVGSAEPADDEAREPVDRPVWEPAENPHQKSAFDEIKGQAEAALREAVEQVQSVVSRARNHVEQIQQYQEQARAAAEEEQATRAAAPASASDATVMANPERQVVSEASATMLMEYLRHVFDLVSMENRLIERRLDSLQESLDRLDRRLSSQAAEVTTRLDALDAVQLPLVRAQDAAAASSTPVREAPPSSEATTAGAGQAKPAIEPELAVPAEGLIAEGVDLEQEVPQPDIAEPVEEVLPASDALRTGLELADGSATPEPSQEPTALEVEESPLTTADSHDLDASEPSSDLVDAENGGAVVGSPTAAAPSEPELTSEFEAETVSVPPTPTDPSRDEPALPDESTDAATLAAGGEQPYNGPPVEGTLAIAGLATFRMLAMVRDALQGSGFVLACEPLRFEAGDAQLRVRATRPLAPSEVQEWLANATGSAVESLGDMSFRVLRGQPGQ